MASRGVGLAATLKENAQQEHRHSREVIRGAELPGDRAFLRSAEMAEHLRQSGNVSLQSTVCRRER